MKRLILIGLLVAGPAMAQTQNSHHDLVTFRYVICVGERACSLATDQNCSVALGDNTQFPPHADHVLVTPQGVRSLNRLDPHTVRLIEKEMAWFEGVNAALDPAYVAEWNKACARVK
jgi:hypothetical protein